MGCSDWPQVLASTFLMFFDLKKKKSGIWIPKKYTYLFKGENTAWNW